jgi:hypothetical protein
MSETETLLVEIRSLRDLVTSWRETDQQALKLLAETHRLEMQIIRTENRSLSRLVYIGFGIVIAFNFFAKFVHL